MARRREPEVLFGRSRNASLRGDIKFRSSQTSKEGAVGRGGRGSARGITVLTLITSKCLLFAYSCVVFLYYKEELYHWKL